MFHGFSGNKTVKRKSSHASEDKRGWFTIEMMEVSLHLRRLPDLDLKPKSKIADQQAPCSALLGGRELVDQMRAHQKIADPQDPDTSQSWWYVWERVDWLQSEPKIAPCAM